MPWPDRNTNFHGDHFNYSIDLSNQGGETVDFLGGMNNAYAARRAFEMLLICHNPPDTLLLRQGARVLVKEQAVGGFREWVLSRSERGQPAHLVRIVMLP